MKRFFQYVFATLFLLASVFFAVRSFQVFFYETERKLLILENTDKAQTLFDSFDNLPYDNSLDYHAQKALLFSLMLLEKNPDALSQLEMLFRAHARPLLFEARDEGPFKHYKSLHEMYDAYRSRMKTLNDTSHYLQRTELLDKKQIEKLENNFQPSNLQHILVFSDFQVRDEESPFHLYPVKPYFPTAYYPANPHVVYAVEDTLRSVRRYESEQQIRIDLAIFTGDLTDNGHYNEVRWGIDVLGGGLIHPDSGADDDIFPGLYGNGEPNDTSDAFIATGLGAHPEFPDSKTIPWYFVAGNHDGLAMGVFLMTYKPINLGFFKLEQGTFGFMNDISIGDTNYLGIVPNLRSMIRWMRLPEAQKKVVADPDRRLLNPVEIAQEMFITTGEPVGHGMQYVADIERDRSYSFVTQTHVDGITIRHIALDTNARNPQGSFGNHKMRWLRKELQDARKQKQLVIVSSHHKPIDIFDNGNRLVRLLKSQPHVIAHLVAHWHKTDIEARPGTHATNGYWEIETGSMTKWPMEMRMLDISVDTAKGIGVIKSTLLTHHTENPYSVSERGRFLSYLEAYLKGGEVKLQYREGKEKDRHTLLYFELPSNYLKKDV